MNDNIWQAEDGRLLKDLRISAGLDTLEFSRAASISPAQLRQLEDGGNELFYSQSIKFQLGRKLLRKLGADVVRIDEQPAPETPSLFGFSPSPANGSSLEEVLSAAPTPVLPEPVKTPQPLNPRWVPILSGLGVLILAGVFGAQLLAPQPDTNQASATPAAQTSPVSTPDVKPAEAPVLTTSLQTANEAPSAPANATPALPVAQPSDVPAAPKPVDTLAGCQWDSGSGNSFMPRGMDKPSTYVHFVANADASICVQDRNQKVTQVNLKAGEKLTVRGAAPWRIQTSQWADVGVFFQGHRMPVPASASLVTLTPRLEPLSETTAQTN